MNPKLVYFFRFALVLLATLMTYLMLSKPSSGSIHGLVNDKVAHCLGFFALAFVLECAFPKTRLIWKVLVLFVYGLAIEIVQLNLSYRHFSWLDWVADMVGVLLYIPLIKPVHAILNKIFPYEPGS